MNDHDPINRAKLVELGSVKPEFARTRDVETSRGLKRGTLYNLHADGKIRGYLLRIRGHRSGVRLWDLNSIDDYIRSQSDRASRVDKIEDGNRT